METNNEASQLVPKFHQLGGGKMKPYWVYTPRMGTHIVQAYTRRHAICQVVVLLDLTLAETAEVTSWYITDNIKEGKDK